MRAGFGQPSSGHPEAHSQRQPTIFSRQNIRLCHFYRPTVVIASYPIRDIHTTVIARADTCCCRCSGNPLRPSFLRPLFSSLPSVLSPLAIACPAGPPRLDTGSRLERATPWSFLPFFPCLFRPFRLFRCSKTGNRVNGDPRISNVYYEKSLRDESLFKRSVRIDSACCFSDRGERVLAPFRKIFSEGSLDVGQSSF